jgi:outer membrane protein
MKKAIVLISALCGVVFAGQAMADTSFGVVNVGQILHTSSQVEAATKAIQDKFAARQKSVKAEETDLKTSVDKLKKDGAVMKAADKKALETTMQSQRKKLLADIASFQKDLGAAQNASMQTIFADLNKVIKKVATDDKLDLVLDSQFVIYSGDKQDITSQVEKAFNAKTATK